MVVLLPAPFCPRNPMISPWVTSKFKSWMAGWPAYRFVRFSTLIIAGHFDETTEVRLRWQIFLARLQAHDRNLSVLAIGADYADRKFYVRAAVRGSKQLLNLFNGTNLRFAYAINHQPTLNTRFICRAAWFNRSN